MVQPIIIHNDSEVDEHKGEAFKLKGNLYVFLLISIVLYAVLSTVLMYYEVAFIPATIISVLPGGAITIFTYAVLNRKPPHYVEDMVEKFIEPDTTEPVSFDPPDGNMRMSARRFQDCMFVDDTIIFNELDERGYVARGFFVNPPAADTLSVSVLNDIYNKLSAFLLNIKAPVKWQFQWNVSDDFDRELELYRSETEKLCRKGSFSELVRNERYRRFKKQQERRILKRQYLRVYFTVQLETPPDGEDTLKIISRQLGSYGHRLTALFSQYNCDVIPMKDDDYFRHYLELFSPDLKRKVIDKLEFNPSKSALEQCVSGSAKDFSDFGFYMGGMYHNIVALKSAPVNFSPGIFSELLNLDIQDYSIAVNLTPLDITKERKETEDLIVRLEGDRDAVPKRYYSIRNAIRKKIKKVEELSNSMINPMQCEYIFRIQAESREMLLHRTKLLREAVTGIHGVVPWDLSGGRSAMNLFYQTLPGWSFGKYSKYSFYSNNSVLAGILPFSSSFTGKMNPPEALYNGGDQGLLGVSTFEGDTPQSSLFLGTTGCGKSSLMIDMLAQSDPYYDFTCIIDDGESYFYYALANEIKPLIIHPDASLTLNYFDLNGLPRTASHVAFCSALLMNMTGYSGEKDKDNNRQAILSKYVQMCYSDIYRTFRREHEETILDVARTCVAVQKTSTQLSDFYESFIEYEKALKNLDERALEVYHQVTEKEITEYLADPSTALKVEQTSFTRIPKDRIIDHYTFIDYIRTERLRDHDPDEIRRICTALEAWSRVGPYGTLFDGESNIDLSNRYVLFELSRIPKSAEALKNMVGFMLLNIVRQHIIQLPKAVRKRIIFEEAAKILSIDAGETLIDECYRQMRKYSTWVASINQDYAKFKNSPVKNVVMNNSKQYFLMRQNDMQDVEDFSETIPLPESSKSAILEFPNPESLPENEKYSSFLYHYAGRNMYFSGVGHNVPGKELLFVASTSGKSFDTANKIFTEGTRKGKNSVEIIKEQAGFSFCEEKDEEEKV